MIGAIILYRARLALVWRKKEQILSKSENDRESKSCIRRVYTEDGCLTSDLKKIMKEVESFYSKLYLEDDLKLSEIELNFSLQS